jgi:hypothetical protein
MMRTLLIALATLVTVGAAGKASAYPYRHYGYGGGYYRPYYRGYVRPYYRPYYRSYYGPYIRPYGYGWGYAPPPPMPYVAPGFDLRFTIP